jgi:hypothetical protein
MALEPGSTGQGLGAVSLSSFGFEPTPLSRYPLSRFRSRTTWLAMSEDMKPPKW